ncbi:hypothetical protein [Marinobacter sp. ELB17]|uniref:hypothetical protein n=1 Tax=Marinobacter sp. ELB17 TaxID=270374 RepID=UPI0000F39C64|nr:hypothetical protein [Marinobacter sp. ELB17]EAZ97245.1 hypothetical protein MELB17_10148 [Marinobacter sp. ELB17]
MAQTKLTALKEAWRQEAYRRILPIQQNRSPRKQRAYDELLGIGALRQTHRLVTERVMCTEPKVARRLENVSVTAACNRLLKFAADYDRGTTSTHKTTQGNTK